MICPPSTLDPWLDGLSPVLDLGCGPGDFLMHLKARAIKASGLELDPTNVKTAKGRGLDVRQGDAFKVLAKSKGKFGAIVMSHVIEHFNGFDAARLLSLCQGALKPGGRIVILTPNPKNLKVITSLFWEDPTHVRPYSPAALRRLLRETGLQEVAIQELPEPARPLPWRLRDAFRRALVGPFWGSQELMVVAQKAPSHPREG